MFSSVIIRKVETAEVDLLLSFSKKTFFDFFGPLNKASDMEAYSVTAFTRQKMLEELTTPDSDFYFALVDDRPVGYLKLNFNDAQNEFKERHAMELERIYVSIDEHGKKIGKQLLHFALDVAKNKGFTYVWLGVWEHNHKAIAFYEHNGFQIFSSHPFLLGDDWQTDLLMRKEL